MDNAKINPINFDFNMISIFNYLIQYKKKGEDKPHLF